MSASDYYENKVLDYLMGAGVDIRPDPLHIALFTAAPSDAGGGTEVAGNGYARVSVANNATKFPAAVAGSKSNGEIISFPQANGGNWGTITHFGIFDASTGGNLLAWGALAQSVPVNDGDTANIQVGALTITLD